MKFYVFFLSLCFCAISTAAQAPSRKIISSPTLQPPAEAVESGLGGRVNVQVEVNKAGDVTDVKQVIGPDWVCPKVQRADVLAIHETAKSVAMRLKFASDQKGTKEWIGITFPSSKKAVDEAAESEVPQTPTSGVTVQMKRPSPRLIKGGVMNGRALSLPRPPYPPDARAARASGVVSMQVLIDEEGKVFSAEPVNGPQLLRPAARWAACGAIFSPTKLEGKAVKVSGIITYNFVP